MTEEKATETTFLAAGEEIVDEYENEIETYRKVNEAQSTMIRQHLETIRTLRNALEGAKAWLEDENNYDGLAKYGDDGSLSLMYGSIDPETGMVEQDENGPVYDQVADWKDTIAAINDGYICWDDEVIGKDTTLALWKQIWLALNPGREFRKMEEKP